MTENADLSNEMTSVLTEDQIEAILAGDPGESVPADYMGVVELVRAARHSTLGAAPPRDVDERDVDERETDEREAAIVAMLAAAVEQAQVIPLRPRRRAAAAVTAAVALVTLSTSAAAATNHLPAPVQDVVSDAASHVGVHVPTSDARNEPPLPPATLEKPHPTIASTASASRGASEDAPPAVTPASGNDDGIPGNSAHDQQPGDVASEAHSDNPSTEDDTHAPAAAHNSSDPTTTDRGERSVRSNSTNIDRGSR